MVELYSEAGKQKLDETSWGQVNMEMQRGDLHSGVDRLEEEEMISMSYSD